MTWGHSMVCSNAISRSAVEGTPCHSSLSVAYDTTHPAPHHLSIFVISIAISTGRIAGAWLRAEGVPTPPCKPTNTSLSLAAVHRVSASPPHRVG
jgi:hypothetical protein